MKFRSQFSISLICLLPLILVMPAHAQTVEPNKKFSPYLPGELNEYALESINSGDLNTAHIFLERANRLNPLSPDIQSNLENVRKVLESRNSFEVRGANTRGEVGVDKKSSAGALEDLPALWPKP